MAQVVVDDLSARGLGEPAHEAILEFCSAPTTALDNPGAQCTEHVAQREDFLLRGPDRRD
jgi:hypothetical protein